MMDNKPTQIASIALVFAVMTSVGYLLTTEIAERFFSTGPSFHDDSHREDSLRIQDRSNSARHREGATGTGPEAVPSEGSDAGEAENNRLPGETAERFVAAKQPGSGDVAPGPVTPLTPELGNSQTPRIASDLDAAHAFDSLPDSEPLIAGGISPSSLQSEFSNSSRPENGGPRNDDDDVEVDDTGVVQIGENSETDAQDAPPEESSESGNHAEIQVGAPTPTTVEASVKTTADSQVFAVAEVTTAESPESTDTPSTPPTPDPSSTVVNVEVQRDNRTLVGNRVGLDYSNALAGSVSGMIGGMHPPAAESQRIQYSPRAGYTASGNGTGLVAAPNVQVGASASADAVASASSTVAPLPGIPSASLGSAITSASGGKGNLPAQAGGSAARNLAPAANGAIPSLPVKVSAGVNAPGLNLKVNLP